SMAQNRGFATMAGAMFVVDDTRSKEPAAIDPQSLPKDEDASIAADATAMLVDLEAADSGAALVRARAEYVDDYSQGAALRPTITVFPARGIVLQDHHRYAAVLTTRVKTKDGSAIGPSPTFQAIRDGQRRTT